MFLTITRSQPNMVTQDTRQADLHLTLQPQALSMGLGLRPGRFGAGTKLHVVD